MAIEKIYLDPNAQSYTPDDVVGKVNAATAKITRAAAVDETALPSESSTFQKVTETETTKLAGIAANAEVNPTDLDGVPDSATRKAMSDTEQTKLTGVEANAKDDQSGAEIRDAVVALADDERKIVVSRPTTGQKKVYAVQTHSDGKTEVEQSDTAES